MRVKAKYEKTGRGTIVARLTVTHRRDYVTENIFWSEQVQPMKEGFSLTPAGQDFIEREFDAACAAESWIHRQVAALTRHVEHWRAIDVPYTEIFTI